MHVMTFRSPSGNPLTGGASVGDLMVGDDVAGGVLIDDDVMVDGVLRDGDVLHDDVYVDSVLLDDRTAGIPPTSAKNLLTDSLAAVARELGIPAERINRRRSRFLFILMAYCTGLIPWIVYLAISMPTGYRAKAWSAAWVGFDILLLTALAATALAGLRRRQIAIPLATVTATLLLCDAWFDIVLDWGTSEVWVSIASAAFVELPLAAVLLSWARTLTRVALQLRWRQLGLPGDPPPLHRIPLLYPSKECPVTLAGESASLPDQPGPVRT